MDNYEIPTIIEGAVIEIYACKGGTCNGKSYAVSLDDNGIIVKKSLEEVEEVA